NEADLARAGRLPRHDHRGLTRRAGLSRHERQEFQRHRAGAIISFRHRPGLDQPRYTLASRVTQHAAENLRALLDLRLVPRGKAQEQPAVRDTADEMWRERAHRDPVL